MSDAIQRAPIEHLPIYTPYPNPHLADFVREHSTPFDEATDTYNVRPFARDISEGKNDPIYNAHSYHTKVPPKAIEPFILHYTQPGDLVLDPFCGSGMTGVAALRNRRKCILIDLAPAATFIAYNYCTPVEIDEFQTISDRVLESLKNEFDWLYETRCRKCDRKSAIEYVIWSAVMQHTCGAEFALWEAAVNSEDGEIALEFACPNCHLIVEKRKLKRVGSVPVRVNYTCPKHGRAEDDVLKFDTEKVTEIQKKWQIEKERLWHPTVRIDRDIDLWYERDYRSLGIYAINDFYTVRNLWAMSRLREAILLVQNQRIRNMLLFAFTSIAQTMTNMYAYRSSRKGGITKGTLYVPALFQEVCVRKAFAGKVKDFAKAFSGQSTRIEDFLISTQSATEIDAIPDESLDYIFTDPPFGSNYIYSDLNLIWESWLGYFTDTDKEAVMHRRKKVDSHKLSDYARLMKESFAQMHRVLKPQRYLTMVFHNSQKAVWDVIQVGLKEAGFENVGINVLDKQQMSFKALTAEAAVGYDVLLTCYKPNKVTPRATSSWTNGDITPRRVEESLTALLSEIPLDEPDKRTAKYLFARLVEPFRGTVPMNIENVQALLDERFKRVDQSYYLWDQVPQTTEGWLVITAIRSEHELVEFLRQLLAEPREWDEIHVEILKHLAQPNQIRREPREILEENFVLDDESGKWRLPNPDEAQSLAHAKERRLIQEFQSFLREWQENGRLPKLPAQPALKAGMKRLYAEHDYRTLIQLGEKIPESALDAELKAVIWAAKARA